MRGTVKPISRHRRLIIDLMRASADVPFVSLARRLDVRPLLEARGQAARPPGFAAILVKAFALVGRDEPALRTLYAKWPWPSLYELPRGGATVAIARVEGGEECVMLQRVCEPEAMTLAEVNDMIRLGKTAALGDVAMYRKTLRATALPWPLRPLAWAIGLNFGRQRGNWFGNFSVTGVAAYGGGELLPLSPGPYLLSFDVIQPDGSWPIVIRWDHRVADAALIARTFERLEQALNGEIAAELRALPPAAEPKPVRAVRG